MKKNKTNGYAIMFTVILVSIISLIGIGLSNTTYKQLLLSSGAKDSQLSFYMSDMATECALYVDINTGNLEALTPFSCGVDKNGNPYLLNITSSGSGDDITYYLNPPSSMSNSSESCFRISINKNKIGLITTKVRASGYNICNKSGNRTVERTIEVNY